MNAFIYILLIIVYVFIGIIITSFIVDDDVRFDGGCFLLSIIWPIVLCGVLCAGLAVLATHIGRCARKSFDRIIHNNEEEE